MWAMPSSSVTTILKRRQEPIKTIQFGNANPVCHHFDEDAKDGNDLIIGLNTGDVYIASLRQQLQDSGKKLVGAMHFNKDGSINSSRCTAVSHVPNVEGLFVAAHADGNVFVYDKTKDSSGDAPFPPVKDAVQFHVAHARSSKSNPVARWHICQGSINGLSFSRDGTYLATVGRDGYLRVFDYAKETLVCGCKSYFGALLCCSWSPDGKYILTGGEDDLVQVWSMEDQAVVAWGVGHNSWVSAVAFDPFWEAPIPDTGAGEVTTYRFGSVGQDTQLLLWDLSMDEVVVPLRMAPVSSGSPSVLNHQAAGWDGAAHSVGPLRHAPARKEVPKLAPVMAHRVHAEPLSGLLFTKEAIVTACHEGNLKIWDRPGHGDNLLNHTPEVPATAVSKDRLLTSGKGGISHLRQ
uniref:Anaphase-promoting complex subunit 4 WD40 domain-containing protein n=1 Tax=Physcomitrium patens TaxID=3218 RepID=A0A7I4F8D6_PHYPA